MAQLGQIQEAFTGTSTPSGWTESDLGSALFAYDSTGATVNLPAATTAATDGDVVYTATQNLTGSFGRLNVTGVSGAGATHTDNVFRVRQNSTNYVTIFYEAGTLFFSKVVASAQTNIASIAYNSTNHAWWQIREKGGITHWETSPDGVNWTTQTSQANPVTVTAVDVLIGAVCFGVDVSPAPFKFKYFNYPLPGTSTSTSSTSSTSSSTSSTSTSISSISTSSTSSSYSSTSTSTSTSSTSLSTSSTSSSISSTSSSTSSTSASSTSSSTSFSSTSSSISSTSMSSTSTSSTSSSTSYSSISTSLSSTSSSISSTSASYSSTSASSTSSSSSTSTTAIPLNLDYTYQDTLTLPTTGADDIDIDTSKNIQNVAVDDSDYFVQYGSENMIQEYKKKWINNTDSPRFIWKGRSTLDTRISPMLVQIYNQGSSSISTYYFDATDSGPTDASAAWTNDASAFDGSITTYASTDTEVAALVADGTTAPTSGNTIISVRARLYGYLSGDGIGTAAYGSYATLSTPSGGWTWAVLNNLETKLFFVQAASGFPAEVDGQVLTAGGAQLIGSITRVGVNTGIAQTGFAARVEIEVTSGFVAGWETLANVNSIPADVDFTVNVSQTSSVSNYYDTNNVVTFRTYQRVL